jgi:hypothetical protein
MAKKKIQCEVEEKGLDPALPHSLLGDDGRLVTPQVTAESPILEVVVQAESVAVESAAETADSTAPTEEPTKTEPDAPTATDSEPVKQPGKKGRKAANPVSE